MLNYRRIYFIGIGGIGMSALARWFKASGREVFGYDKTETPLTQQLSAEGISVNYSEELPEGFLLSTVEETKEQTLVVYTPAVPLQHKALAYAMQQGFKVVKRSDLLSAVVSSQASVGVAGTHGKTTTTSMVAHLLKSAGKDMAAFVGGIMANYASNVLLSEQLSGDTIMVVEADEYDRSFLKLWPSLSIITSMDADHLDIYGTLEEVQKAFAQYASQTKQRVLLRHPLATTLCAYAQPSAQLLQYGLGPEADIWAENIRIEQGRYCFDYCEKEGFRIHGLELWVPGMHNVENATAAIAAARFFGVDAEQLRLGIQSFRGVKRRFEYKVRGEKLSFVDDYAHHPVELAAFVRTAKQMFPERELHVAFQPHLYSRTKDFYKEFAASLDIADHVYLLPIYPARELPIPGVQSEMIAAEMKSARVSILSKEQLLQKVQSLEKGIFASVGAGDIDAMLPDFQRIIELKNKGYESNT